MESLYFQNLTITMSANLYKPDDFQEVLKYPAIIVIHPAGGVKEQTADYYAHALAKNGFLTLTFDASYQGESGGEPRLLDEPMNRVNDIFSAIDYLVTLPFVNADRIGVVGICAGGGYAIKATTLDRRIKAVATASAVNVGDATRKGWDGKSPVTDLNDLLATISEQRTTEARGGEAAYAPYVPNLDVHNTSQDLQDGAEYYLTERGQHPNSVNKMLLTSLSAWAAFDAFNLVSSLLTQPVCIVAGSKADSLWHSKELYKNALGKKELFIIENASHMDLYDKEADTVIQKVTPFFLDNL